MPTFKRIVQQLFRRKTFSGALEESQQTQLARCLTTTDLIALGVGSTLGAGVYVLTGSVARDKAGPSIVLSFLVAAVASVMAGLCYAEFGSRVPKAGSAYVYSYITLGELWAFVIGWNLILEYVIGTSSVARAWSENVDALIGGKFRNFSLTYLKMETQGFAEYPDFFAFAIILVLTAVLCFGVKESALFSKIFTGVNILIIMFVIVAGSISANVSNWYITEDDIQNYFVAKCNSTNATNQVTNLTSAATNISTDEKCAITKNFGTGGFFPYGISGMMSGAATCFFGFVGFDIIATTGEEVKNPQRSIPISIVVSLLIVFVAYFGISIVLTLMVPYYIMDAGAPLPMAFGEVGWNWAVYPLAVGATCALSSSLMGGLFPMPRIVYAMAQDGLIFRFLARINQRFKTPLIATILSGLLAGVMVLLFDLEDLVDMMSIGTLLAYTLVAMCVLILRYQPDITVDKDGPRVSLADLNDMDSNASFMKKLVNPKMKFPTTKSGTLVYSCVMIIGVLSFLLCATLVNFAKLSYSVAIILCCVLSALIILMTIIIIRQPQSNKVLAFTVPFVPILPIFSTICNIYLMCELSTGTWIRFSVWMAIGFLIYGGYGFRNSSEQRRYKKVPVVRSTSFTQGHNLDRELI
nr:cationic amino acid transporter 2 [Ciona intestinalis]|eukprot:XP_018669272.1 cationic amino acid transporter 2 [Ciona intestinalis]